MAEAAAILPRVEPAASSTVPPWMSEELLAAKPDLGRCGAATAHGPEPMSPTALAELAGDDRARIGLVWTDDHPRWRFAAEVPALRDALTEGELRRLQRELRSGLLLVTVFGGLWLALGALQGRGSILPALPCLVGIDMALVARSGLRRLRRDADRYWDEQAAEARYGLWLGAHPARGIRPLLVVIAGVSGLAMAADGDAWIVDERTILAGALVRDLVLAGEWWRLGTSGLLHVGIVHLLMNGLALLAFGPVVARQVGGGRLVAWFAAGVVGGALLSIAVPRAAPSMGASGGLCALLGGLAVLAWRWRATAPAGLRRWLLRSLLMLAALSLAAPTQIDHLAHLGGLLAGAALAALAPTGFPPIAETIGSRLAGASAWAGIVLAAAWTSWRLGEFAEWW